MKIILKNYFFNIFFLQFYFFIFFLDFLNLQLYSVNCCLHIC